MRFILSNSFDPYFHIAAEELLLKENKEEVVFLYRNRPSIIVGKHQNTFAEINMSFAKKNNIDIVRRISGGGAVYHDEGNLNFCFIRNKNSLEKVSIPALTHPIFDFLTGQGLEIRSSKRNDFTLNNRKFSGNAMHIYKDRILCHGTILFDTELDQLIRALDSRVANYDDKGIRSKRSRVTNLKEGFQDRFTNMEEFGNTLRSYFEKTEHNFREENFSDNEIEQIKKSISEKYKTWEWNFGYSPKFKTSSSISHKNEKFDFSAEIIAGKVSEIRVNEKNSTSSQLENILNDLYTGKKYHEELFINDLDLI